MKAFEFSDRYVFFQPRDTDELHQQVTELFRLAVIELDRQGIDRNSYFIGIPDGSSDGCVCFHEEGDFWVHYVAERGARYNLNIFSSPSDGINFLIWSFLASPRKRNGDVGFIPFVSV